MSERRVKHRYAKVSRRMQSDERVQRLSTPPPCGLSLWRWLLTCRQGGSLPGVICMGEAAIAEANEWTVEGLREPLAELLREGLIEIDTNACLVWLPKALNHSAPDNGNTVTGWSLKWDEVPECGLKSRIYDWLRAHMVARDEADEARASKANKPKKTDWLGVFEQACGSVGDNRFGEYRETVPGTVADTVAPTVPSRARVSATGTGTGAGEPLSSERGVQGGAKASPASPPRPKAKRKRGKRHPDATQLPADWEPSAQLRAHVAGPPYRLSDEAIDLAAIRFVATFREHADNDTAIGWKVNWDLAFKKWCAGDRGNNPRLAKRGQPQLRFGRRTVGQPVPPGSTI